LGPVVAGGVYDRTQSYAIVLLGMTILLVIATALTSFLIRPWSAMHKRMIAMSSEQCGRPSFSREQKMCFQFTTRYGDGKPAPGHKGVHQQ
ncbi:MAG: hypothetical protein ACREO5_15040, partial [Candidatus Binatia bacterium]